MAERERESKVSFRVSYPYIMAIPCSKRESYEWLVFPFHLLLRFQAGDLSFLHSSPGICQFLQARRVVGVLLIKLQCDDDGDDMNQFLRGDDSL